MEKNVNTVRLKKLALLALRIALGSSIAIYIATLLKLQFAPSAGIIALLTVLTTRWETLKLSVFRLLTFAVSVLLCWITFEHMGDAWVAYGIYIFLLVFMCNWFHWQATISVNAVIGTHLLSTHDYSAASIGNELMLVIIGITVAVILNLIHPNNRQREKLIEDMRYTENQLQTLLGELSSYLHKQVINGSVWQGIAQFETQLDHSMEQAYEYRGNTLKTHTSYYADYFEMRAKQSMLLHNLHYEMRKIRNMPVQAEIVAGYIDFLREHLKEKTTPEEHMCELHRIIESMSAEPLPVSREEFESRAILYHILMDLEEFIVLKKRFVEGLSEEQRKIYWAE